MEAGLLTSGSKGDRFKATVLRTSRTRSCALCADEVGGTLPGPWLPWVKQEEEEALPLPPCPCALV